MTQRYSPERRRFPRIEVAATVLAMAPQGFVGSYLVRNLSLGGALLSGGPALARLQTAKLLFQIPGRPSVGLSARIVRHDRSETGEHLFGVAFRDLCENELKFIKKIGLEVLNKKGVPPTVLLASGTVEGKKIEQEVQSLGLVAAVASTPIQMVCFLQDPSKWFEIAIVDETFGRQDGMGALSFLANEYPEIFRIMRSSRKCGDEFLASKICANSMLVNSTQGKQLREILSTFSRRP